jgi:hypothetical protein
MPPSKNMRDMAAARAAVNQQPEPIPELPEPLAGDARTGLQRGRELAARFGENLALYAAAIAFGDGTKSLHTRLQAMQLLWNMVEEVPETVPAPPDNGRGHAVKGCP